MAYNDYGLSSMWTPTPAPVKQESMANMKNEAVRGAYLDYQLDQAVKTGLITEGEREAMRKGYLQAQQPQQANTLVKPPSTQPLSPVPPVNGLLPPTRGPGTGGPYDPSRYSILSPTLSSGAYDPSRYSLLPATSSNGAAQPQAPANQPSAQQPDTQQKSEQGSLPPNDSEADTGKSSPGYSILSSLMNQPPVSGNTLYPGRNQSPAPPQPSPVATSAPGAPTMPQNALTAPTGTIGRTMTPWTGSRENYRDVGRAIAVQRQQQEQQAALKAKLDQLKTIHSINPAAAVQAWNSDPQLSRMGRMDIAADGEVKLWKDPDTVVTVGRSIRLPDGSYHVLPTQQQGAQSDIRKRVADSLLDPALQGKAFEARMKGHGQDLPTLAKSRREFGTHPVAEQAPAITKKPSEMTDAELLDALGK